MPRPAYLIYINGFPGVGKLTLAQHLQHLIPGSRILHNHELIDPVEKRYPRGSAAYQRERTLYRQARLAPIMHDPELRSTVFIFTDSQASADSGCVGDYTDLAMGEKGRRFYSVVLHCEEEENVRRLTSDGRGGGLNGKLTDAEVLRSYRRRDGIWKFEDEDEIEVDVTDVQPAEAAGRVREFVRRRETEGRGLLMV